MAKIDKTYDFKSGEDIKYIIDQYQTYTFSPSTEIDRNGVLRLKNTSDHHKSENFYGDGRLGDYQERTQTDIAPTCGYVRRLEDHPIYGWVLYDMWISTREFEVGDEVVIYKKHIKEEQYLNELGEWAYVTITERIEDADGVHYAIEEPPPFEFTENTANNVTKVLQFKSLTLLDNTGLYFDGNYSAGYVDMPDTLWNGRRISRPEGFLHIKSQEPITVGRGAHIASKYGYGGANAYVNYYSTNRNDRYADAHAPLGAGTDKSVTNGNLNADIRDIRSAGVMQYTISNTGNIHDLNININTAANTCGGPGNNGINFLKDTFQSNAMPVSLDLNERMYMGLGGNVFRFYLDTGSSTYTTDTYQANAMYGRSGGGVLIINAPELVFMDKNSRVGAWSGSKSRRRALGYGGGGSVILKVEKLVFKENPALMSKVDETGVYSNFNIGTTINELRTTYSNYYSAPGQIQLEFDKWVNEYDNTILSYEEVTESVYKNHIIDFYEIEKWNKAHYSIINAQLNDLLPENSDPVDYSKEEMDSLSGQLDYPGLCTLIPWSNNGLTKYEPHSYLAPRFETNRFFKTFTRGVNNLNITNWYDIYKFEVFHNTHPDTEIRIVFSLDNGSTWRYIDLDSDPDNPSMEVATLAELDLTTKSNTPEQYNNFDNRNWFIENMIQSQVTRETRTIDFCFCLKTSKSHITPFLTGLWATYDSPSKIGAAIPIRPYNGEEFNNEYVNFVWLQPSQRSGSVQNRIEISTNPSFETFEKDLVIDDNDISQTSGTVQLPFKKREVSNRATVLSDFKLPYLKQRDRETINVNDHMLPSITFDNDTGTVKYHGNDIFFYKGKEVVLSEQAEISYPTAIDFTLKSITVPKASSIISHIDFTNLTTIDDINHIKGPWQSHTAGSLLEVETNLAHGKVPSFFNNGSSYISSVIPVEGILTENTLKLDAATTEYFRFNLKYSQSGTMEIMRRCRDMNSTLYSIIAVETKLDSMGNKVCDLRYHNGYSWYWVTTTNRFEFGTENVIVCKNFDNNYIEFYVNGFLVGSYDKRLYYNPQSYYTQVCNYQWGIDGFTGNILEYAAWDGILEDEEVKQISQVPIYHLRYNFADNTMEWYNVPYTDHLAEYKYISDKTELSLNQNEFYRYEINQSAFASSKRECYNTTFHSIKLGTFCPNAISENSFWIETATFKPISGIPFLYNRTGYNVPTMRERLRFNDDNTIDANWMPNFLIYAHDRIEVDKEGLDLSFYFSENEYTSNDYIALMTGSMLNATETAGYTYSRQFRLEGPNTFSYWMRHTNNTVYQAAASVSFPYPLISDNIYTLSMVINNSLEEISFWLKSNTDNNYVTPVKIWDSTMTTYVQSSHGYATDNFNDISHYHTAPYEEYGFATLNGSDKPARFKPISMNPTDINTVETNNAGYIDRYSVTNTLNGGLLHRLNGIQLLGTTETTETDVKIFFRFGGITSPWKVYDAATDEWVVTTDLDNDGMTPQEAMSLTTYNFENTDGVDYDKDVTVLIRLSTTDSKYTPRLNMFRILYNGPMILDSWDSPGSYYNEDEFYYNQTNNYSPVIDADFTDAGQGWEVMGSDEPDYLKQTDTNGSPVSTATTKVYGGLRKLLLPKGKWYWRVGAYNGS